MNNQPYPAALSTRVSDIEFQTVMDTGFFGNFAMTPAVHSHPYYEMIADIEGDFLSTLAFPNGTNADNFHEPHVIELPDGSLYGMIRAQGNNVAHGFTMYSTVSNDGGYSWSEMTSTDVSGSTPHPYAPFIGRAHLLIWTA